MQKHLKTAIKVLFIVTWFLMFGCLVYDLVQTMRAFEPFGPRDVSRRLTAPDRSRTALLERDYGFLDLNFRLYMMDGESFADLPRDFGEALWMSQDYEYRADYNWHEDAEWSTDSSVVAVIIEGQFVFAYDFTSDQEFEDSERIQNLLQSRGGVQE